jgi:aspartate/methionine/tyrosine aminotransferase
VAELGHPRGAVYEPAPLGHLEARRAVAGYYGARGARVSAERVVLSASTSEAYSWLFGLLADPDDTILVPRPSYPLLGWIAAQRRVRLVPYQLSREANFRIDLPDLRRAIDRRTRAIVLVNPNNPTGSFVRKDEIVELFSLAREHDLALIVDEVFADYPLDAAPTDVVSSFTELFEVGSGAAGPVAPLCFVLSGLSKVLLLPQCKLGWTVVNGPDEMVTEALGRLELIADLFSWRFPPSSFIARRSCGRWARDFARTYRPSTPHWRGSVRVPPFADCPPTEAGMRRSKLREFATKSGGSSSSFGRTASSSIRGISSTSTVMASWSSAFCRGPMSFARPRSA